MWMTAIEGEIVKLSMDLEARDHALADTTKSKEQRMKSQFTHLIPVFK